MITWSVEQRADRYVLVERDYPAQGISPFYSVMCRLEPEEAGALHKSRLVRIERGAIPDLPPADPKTVLQLRQPQDGLLELWLCLPESEGRNAMELKHPGYESMLAEAGADPQKRANLVANTGISDVSAGEVNDPVREGAAASA